MSSNRFLVHAAVVFLMSSSAPVNTASSLCASPAMDPQSHAEE